MKTLCPTEFNLEEYPILRVSYYLFCFLKTSGITDSPFSVPFTKDRESISNCLRLELSYISAAATDERPITL